VFQILVLAFLTVMKDAALYGFSSECFDERPADLIDSLKKAHLHFTLGERRRAMVLLNRVDGKVLGVLRGKSARKGGAFAIGKWEFLPGRAPFQRKSSCFRRQIELPGSIFMRFPAVFRGGGFGDSPCRVLAGNHSWQRG